MANCVKCGREVIPLEIGLTKKLTGRNADKYYCKTCLAKEYNTTESKLDEMAESFRKQGCALFPKN